MAYSYARCRFVAQRAACRVPRSGRVQPVSEAWDGSSPAVSPQPTPSLQRLASGRRANTCVPTPAGRTERPWGRATCHAIGRTPNLKTVFTAYGWSLDFYE